MTAAHAHVLADAEYLLRSHSPDEFESSLTAAAECIEVVRTVEDEEAWRAAYDSVDSFYAAHEARHPDIRVYAAVRREIETADPLTSPGGTIAQRIARHRDELAG